MFSTCGRIACYGLRFAGRSLRCPNCGSTLMVFHAKPGAVQEAERLIACAAREIDAIAAAVR